jgi:hypothetical protein
LLLLREQIGAYVSATNSYTPDSLVLYHQASSNGGGISKIRAGIDLMQNARMILGTTYFAKD